MLADSTYLNGISAIAIVIVAIVFGIRFMQRYRRENKKLMLFVSLLGFQFVGLYLGPFVSFWSLVFNDANISATLYGQLSYTVAPLAFVNSLWLGFSIFAPAKKKLVLIIFGLSAIPFYIALFGFPNVMIGTETDVALLNASGLMLDISLKSVVLGILALYILSGMLVLGTGFIRLRMKVGGAERKRATYLAIGAFLFGIAGMLDTTVSSEFIVIARMIMVTFLVVDYFGWWARITPKPSSPILKAPINIPEIN